jgi:hypothetical protein
VGVELTYDQAIALLRSWVGCRVRHETLLAGEPHGRAYQGVLLDVTDQQTRLPPDAAVMAVSEQPVSLDTVNPWGAAFAFGPSDYRGATREDRPGSTVLSTDQGVWTWRWILLDS